jgi:hypothetical protein
VIVPDDLSARELAVALDRAADKLREQAPVLTRIYLTPVADPDPPG